MRFTPPDIRSHELNNKEVKLASRRMFALEVIDSDQFLEMPLSSQALYFHLGMRADDEGFITPQKVIRLISAVADDLKILVAKGFAKIFDDGVLLLLHWDKNNWIRDDRKVLSEYHDRKSELLEDKTMSVKCLTNVSVVKDSIGKVSKVKLNTTNAPALGDEPEFIFWTEKTGTTIRAKFDENIKAAHRLKEKLTAHEFVRAIETIRLVRADSHAGRFLHVIGNYIQLEKNIEAIEAYRKGIEERPGFEKKLQPAKSGKIYPERYMFDSDEEYQTALNKYLTS